MVARSLMSLIGYVALWVMKAQVLGMKKNVENKREVTAFSGLL